ncbi:MAG TPA: hypothetical protein EYM49_02905, partial [Campylobacterales bacterium]|nr:hypothetical protein [Campylobacterales bacterium]
MISFIKNIKPTIRKIEQILGLSIKVFLVTSIVVVLFGVYVSNLIYGNYSLKIVNRLEDERKYLQEKIELLKQE